MTVKNDLTVLIIDGEPTDEQLRDAHYAVMDNFAYLSGAMDNEATRLYKDIARRREMIFSIATIAEQMADYDSEELVQRAYRIFNSCGLLTRGWPAFPTEREMKQIRSYVSRLSVSLRDRLAEYERLHNRASKSADNAESNFFSEIGAISDFTKRSIDFDYNLAMYAADIHRFTEYAKQVEGQRQLINSK